MSKSSLSSVVSSLVRASMGSSVPSNVADDDLDRHVAELILKEAKQKAEKYAKEGIRAYVPQPDSTVPKTNKRFLSSIIRSTDDHNKTILRSQALAAQEVRMERLEQEKKERRARAEEAVEAERSRRLMGGSRSSHRDRDRERNRERKRRERSWERRSDNDEDLSRRKGKEREYDKDRSDDRHRRRYGSRSPRRDGVISRSRRLKEDKHRNRYRSRSRSNDDSVVDDRWLRHRERNANRTKSPQRDHNVSVDEDNTHHVKRKRRRRSRSPFVNVSDEDGYLRKGERLWRSRERKPEPISPLSHSDDSLAESGSDTRRRWKDASGDNTLGNSLNRDQTLHSRQSSAFTEDGNGERSRHRPITYLDTTTPELGLTLSGETPTLKSNTRDRAYEQAETGPSALFPSPLRDPSLSPGPPPPPSIPDSPLPPPISKSKSRSSRHHSRKSKPVPPPPSSAPPPLPPHLPSKMDKYFEESYDPRLDVAPLNAPSIPATGLISDAEFAGWDAMLELIRQRREDKEERKRLDRWGIGKDTDKDLKKSTVTAPEAVDIMSIEYKKRGAVREWDLGKEGF